MPSPLPNPDSFANGLPMARLAGDHRLPLQGLTVLAVEDSRFASEALRLMCNRAGARLRRADTLASARAHLRVYRPDVVIIDLGLPDGRGEALIRDLVLARPRPAVILGSSGNPNGRGTALAAGTDGFLEKPLESLSGFCAALAALLPDLPKADAGKIGDRIDPDPLARQDDLARAAHLLNGVPDAQMRRYVAGFLYGLARQAHDGPLAHAAARAMQTDPGGAVEELRGLIGTELATVNPGFPSAHG